jgi:UDP-N-acetylglucosamine 2-epimerase (non-hydrolysing)
LTPSQDADANLRAEGIPEERIRFVGNVMIDSLLGNLERAELFRSHTNLCLPDKGYAVLTLHRPSNVDEQAAFVRILDALDEIARRLPIVFPAHPRTRKMIAELGLTKRVEEIKRLFLIDPIGYLDFLQLLNRSCLALTDSGGIQEETTVLGIPCVTLRENTERPITVEIGTNTIAGTVPANITKAAFKALDNPPNPAALCVPPLWDGHTADRILDALLERMKAEG